jgi:hypothetical protein
MRKIFIVTAMMAALSGSAEAGLVCVNSAEMKVLQSAALQQQLMVAALTCHLTDDYNRFVTSYRSKLIASDNELKAFFAAHRRGEDYNAYKTRIANTVSLRSLHDPRFCDSAQQVFDVALGRSGERRGLVPDPPQLIDTGYEGCRTVDDKVIEAEARKPETKVAAVVPKPAPRTAKGKPVRMAAKPVMMAQAAPELRTEPQAGPEEFAEAPKAAPVPVVDPPKALPPVSKVAPVRVAEAASKPVPETLKPVAKPAPVRVAEAAPRLALDAPKPLPKPAEARPVTPKVRQAWNSAPPRSETYTDEASHDERLAQNEMPDDYDGDDTLSPEDRALPDPQDPPAPQYAPEPRYTPPPQYSQPPQYSAPPQRYAAVERPQWRTSAPDAYRDGVREEDDDDAAYGDNPVPNAYRAGSQWVTDPDNGWRRPPPAAWRSASYYPPPPPRWRLPPGARLVLAPNGRWVVVFARGPRWARY